MRRQLLAGDAVEAFLDLPIEHRQRLVAVALLERFADADDRRQRRAVSAACIFLFTRRVGLAEQRAALGVADDHVARAGLAHHRRADLAGERALALPVHVLRADGDVAVARRVRRRVQAR